jgi:hypothetical protein
MPHDHCTPHTGSMRPPGSREHAAQPAGIRVTKMLEFLRREGSGFRVQGSFFFFRRGQNFFSRSVHSFFFLCYHKLKIYPVP